GRLPPPRSGGGLGRGHGRGRLDDLLEDGRLRGRSEERGDGAARAGAARVGALALRLTDHAEEEGLETIPGRADRDALTARRARGGFERGESRRVLRAVELDLDPLVAREELGRRAESAETAAVEDRDPVAGVLHVGEEVRREEDRLPARGELDD